MHETTFDNIKATGKWVIKLQQMYQASANLTLLAAYS